MSLAAKKGEMRVVQKVYLRVVLKVYCWVAHLELGLVASSVDLKVVYLALHWVVH